MDRADACAGQQGKDPFDDHRHVDGNAVAPCYSDRLERVGHRNDFGVELAVGQRAAVGLRVVGFENDRSVVTAPIQMAVHCIVAQVQFPIGEPGDLHRVVRPFSRPGRLMEPVQPLCLFEPEAVAVFDRPLVQAVELFERAPACFGIAKAADNIEHGLSPLSADPDSSSGTIRAVRPRSYDQLPIYLSGPMRALSP